MVCPDLPPKGRARADKKNKIQNRKAFLLKILDSAMKNELVNLMKTDGFKNIKEVVGKDT